MKGGLALAGATIRLSPVRRVDLADHLIALVAASIQLGHPHAARLGRLKATQFYRSGTDAVLLAGVERLTAFISDQAADGNRLAAWHPLWVPTPSTTGAE